MAQIRAILTDIEGTTSSIDFVKEVLFPYAATHLHSFLQAHQQKPYIQDIITTLQQLYPIQTQTLADINQLLQHWIAIDQKQTQLKSLQGYIWQAGYENKDFTAHLYPDAIIYLKKWSQELHYKMYVYSSGSVKAQDLFFSYSDAGNIKHYFNGFFDTTIGAKNQSDSYLAIADALHLKPDQILFLSDSLAEVQAAKASQMQTCQILRDLSTSANNTNNFEPCVQNFEEVHQLFKL